MELATVGATIAKAKKFIADLQNAKVATALQEQATVLLGEIIALQLIVSSIVKAKDEAHEEAQEYKNRYMKLSDWNAQAAGYELKEIASGVFVYASKEDAERADPAHWLCPNCYEARNKSILQRELRRMKSTIYGCPRCHATYVDHSDPPAPR